MSCPNNCNEPARLVLVQLEPEDFAEIQGAALYGRKGTETVLTYHTDDETLTIELAIDQDAYKTHNFFKYRNAFENEDHVTVKDNNNGNVELIFTPPLGCKANQCPNCDAIYNAQLNEDPSQPSIFKDHQNVTQPI